MSHFKSKLAIERRTRTRLLTYQPVPDARSPQLVPSISCTCIVSSGEPPSWVQKALKQNTQATMAESIGAVGYDGLINQSLLSLSNSSSSLQLPEQVTKTRQPPTVRLSRVKGERGVAKSGLFASSSRIIGTEGTKHNDLTKERMKVLSSDQTLQSVKEYYTTERILALHNNKFLHQSNITEQLARLQSVIKAILEDENHPINSKITVVNGKLDLSQGFDVKGVAFWSLHYLLKAKDGIEGLRHHTLAKLSFPFAESSDTAVLVSESNDFKSATVKLRPRDGNEVDMTNLAKLCIVTKEDELLAGCQSQPKAGRQVFGIARANPQMPIKKAFKRKSNLIKLEDGNITLHPIAGSNLFVRKPKSGEEIGTTELGKIHKYKLSDVDGHSEHKLCDVDGHSFDSGDDSFDSEDGDKKPKAKKAKSATNI